MKLKPETNPVTNCVTDGGGVEMMHVPLEEQEQLRKLAVLPARRRPAAAGQRPAATAVSSKLLSILRWTRWDGGHSARARGGSRQLGTEMLLRYRNSRCVIVSAYWAGR